MVCRRPCLQELSNSISATNNKLTLLVIVLLAASVFAQEQSQPSAKSDQTQTEAKNSNITIPAGTHLALVLTQPVQTRYTRRGDDVYAQVTSPVDAENQVVIPPGTFVQGTVD
jgi:type IV secretory pathway VirB10-like protein